MVEDADVETVAHALGHRFEKPALLQEALTHRSFANEHPHLASRDNERLEFLGDAVVELAASLTLWEALPDAPEGELTRRRADLVCESGLAEVAEAVGIGAAIRLGRGEERSGGRKKPRLLSSAFEACMGAVFLDGGSEVALEVGRRLFAARVERAQPGARDYKSRAQEYAQSLGWAPPRYEVHSAEGPDHDRRFHVAMMVGGEAIATGTGRSKLEAEQAAARAGLHCLAPGGDNEGGDGGGPPREPEVGSRPQSS